MIKRRKITRTNYEYTDDKNDDWYTISGLKEKYPNGVDKGLVSVRLTNLFNRSCNKYETLEQVMLGERGKSGKVTFKENLEGKEFNELLKRAGF